MIELPFIFVAGLLGSSHCVGMCGPFALLLGSTSTTWVAGLVRQLLYSCGRLFTYSTMGGVAGYGGWELAQAAPQMLHLPSTLAILAGVFLIYQGLLTAGVLGRAKQTTGSHACLASGLLQNYLRSPLRRDVFLAGVFTGFLPCGLVYGFLGMAASTRDVVSGMLTMAVFGLGTIPIMVAVASGGKLLSLTMRTRLLHYAAWCVVLAGVLSIARGVSFWGVETSPSAVEEACPLCQ